MLHCFPGGLLLTFPAVISICQPHSADVCRHQTVTSEYSNHVPTVSSIKSEQQLCVFFIYRWDISFAVLDPKTAEWVLSPPPVKQVKSPWSLLCRDLSLFHLSLTCFCFRVALLDTKEHASNVPQYLPEPRVQNVVCRLIDLERMFRVHLRTFFF